jgi:hypothetical protein
MPGATILRRHALRIDMPARTSPIRLIIAVAAAVVSSVSCRDFVATPAFAAPALPAGAEALIPPSTYAEWWRATEQCAGRVGALSRVRWFSVPGRTSFAYLDGQYDGYWWDDVHWIILAGDKVDNGMIVRHEMLHELLGRGDHPPAFFQERCAAVVQCNDVCRAGD